MAAWVRETEMVARGLEVAEFDASCLRAEISRCGSSRRRE